MKFHKSNLIRIRKFLLLILIASISHCFPVLRINISKEGKNSSVRKDERTIKCTILLYDTGKCGLMDNMKNNERMMKIEEKYVPKIFSYTSYLHSLFIITAPFIWIGNTTTLIEIKQIISSEKDKLKNEK